MREASCGTTTAAGPENVQQAGPFVTRPECEAMQDDYSREGAAILSVCWYGEVHDRGDGFYFDFEWR
ncbi:hypothetical protein EV193_104442 [Herbihabitans rhizosphaerae]|uniref:Uncharacterized protein n=1 Tax=Herbihabitans rhizosphaerae TaxID=1872711 RepID=A0A4Q7KS25_9PSEU|nr:hypothetical protein [Herbihabitans rhizosphaerae]RZS39226.1 hypothetical protein EV193_104442 [Herbihabitans rhizosphaerae]